MNQSLRRGRAAAAFFAALFAPSLSSHSICRAFVGAGAAARTARRTKFDVTSRTAELGGIGTSQGGIMAPSVDRSVVRPASSDGDEFRIGYLSDIEGHWDYFLECVERSNVLDWEDADRAPLPANDNSQNNNAGVKFMRLTLRPDSHFVYGGDTVDKGPGDIRLVRSLVSLKRRYPDRVHLLVGNRDLNKVRLTSELSDADMARDIDEIPPPFWDRKAKSLRKHLEGVAREKGADGDDGDISLEELNTRPERLRYMLKHTLGCPDTFEFRREEVKILTRIHGEYPPKSEIHEYTPMGGDFDDSVANIEVSDEEVVESFLFEMSREGSLRQYLELSQIGAIVGNTIFVHGAIDRLTMKYVPSLDTKFRVPKHPPPRFHEPHAEDPADGKIVEDVREWIRSLNEYLHHGLDDFGARPGWNEDRTSRGGEGLLAIQNRPSMWGRSVVCNSYADGGVIATKDAEEERLQAIRTAQELLDPLAFEGIASNVLDPVPAKWLLEHGIMRVVVGHKPTGDCPAVLSSKYTGVEVVAVDTSYSHRRDLHDRRRFGDSRGEAIATVEIAGRDGSDNRLATSGVLACGTEYSNEYPALSGGPDDDAEGRREVEDSVGDPCLGRKLADGWWVKTAVPPNYHLCRGSGRTVEYDVRDMREVVDELLEVQ